MSEYVMMRWAISGQVAAAGLCVARPGWAGGICGLIVGLGLVAIGYWRTTLLQDRALASVGLRPLSDGSR